MLRLREVPEPVPQAGELLIRVFASTVNRTDCGFLRGTPSFVRLFTGVRKRKVSILGNEFAGQVEAVGPDVMSFAVGDRVFGFDGVGFGAHAQYMTTPESGLVARIPAGMTYEQAAPSTEGAHYALNVIKAAGVTRGQDVLVYGATGAIGSAAVQLVKHLGARVTAVCATKDVELVKSLGAGPVIDYTVEDFTRIGEVFDVVIDAVGKSSFRRCSPLLKPKGRYVSTDLGFLGQNPLLAITTRFISGKKVLFPIPRVDPKEMVLLGDLMVSREFRAVVDRTYSLDDIVEAYTYVETGAKTGNVVIRVVEGT